MLINAAAFYPEYQRIGRAQNAIHETHLWRRIKERSRHNSNPEASRGPLPGSGTCDKRNFAVRNASASLHIGILRDGVRLSPLHAPSQLSSAVGVLKSFRPHHFVINDFAIIILPSQLLRARNRSQAVTKFCLAVFVSFRAFLWPSLPFRVFGVFGGLIPAGPARSPASFFVRVFIRVILKSVGKPFVIFAFFRGDSGSGCGSWLPIIFPQ
jgi:hypothetical protein